MKNDYYIVKILLNLMLISVICNLFELTTYIRRNKNEQKRTGQIFKG